MQIEIATLFPEMCEAVLSESIIGRARAALNGREPNQYWGDFVRI